MSPNATSDAAICWDDLLYAPGIDELFLHQLSKQSPKFRGLLSQSAASTRLKRNFVRTGENDTDLRATIPCPG